MIDSSAVTLEWEGGTAIVTVRRPGTKNALDLPAMDELACCVRAAAKERRLRVLILASEGTEAFISGGDIKALRSLKTARQGAAMARKMSGILRALEKLPIPVMAAAEGYAFGGGWEIMAACDLRVASPRTSIGFRQARWGLMPGWGGTKRLLRLVGHARAAWLLLTDQTLDADAALRIGFVHEIVPEGTVLARCREIGRRISELPGDALAAIKKSLFLAGNLASDAAFARDLALFARLWASPEHRRRVAVFADPGTALD